MVSVGQTLMPGGCRLVLCAGFRKFPVWPWPLRRHRKRFHPHPNIDSASAGATPTCDLATSVVPGLHSSLSMNAARASDIAVPATTTSTIMNLSYPPDRSGDATYSASTTTDDVGDIEAAFAERHSQRRRFWRPQHFNTPHHWKIDARCTTDGDGEYVHLPTAPSTRLLDAGAERRPSNRM